MNEHVVAEGECGGDAGGGGGQHFHPFYTGEPLLFMERQGREAEPTMLQCLELIHDLRQVGS